LHQGNESAGFETTENKMYYALDDDPSHTFMHLDRIKDMQKMEINDVYIEYSINSPLTIEGELSINGKGSDFYEVLAEGIPELNNINKLEVATYLALVKEVIQIDKGKNGIKYFFIRVDVGMDAILGIMDTRKNIDNIKPGDFIKGEGFLMLKVIKIPQRRDY
jgi:hypothetical protein